MVDWRAKNDFGVIAHLAGVKFYIPPVGGHESLAGISNTQNNIRALVKAYRFGFYQSCNVRAWPTVCLKTGSAPIA